jgi:hypothetical protein
VTTPHRDEDYAFGWRHQPHKQFHLRVKSLRELPALIQVDSPLFLQNCHSVGEIRTLNFKDSIIISSENCNS